MGNPGTGTSRLNRVRALRRGLSPVDPNRGSKTRDCPRLVPTGGAGVSPARMEDAKPSLVAGGTPTLPDVARPQIRVGTGDRH